MAPHKAYTLGKEFALDELKPVAPVKKASPRDIALEEAITKVATMAPNVVVPFYLGPNDKPGTATASARRIVARLELPVNVGTHKAYPGAILLSTGILSNKGNRKTGN